MRPAFLPQSVFCPVFIWGPLKSQPAAEAVPGKLISVTLVYFPLLSEFFFSHGVGLSVTTGERLGRGSLSFWRALVSGGAPGAFWAFSFVSVPPRAQLAPVPVNGWRN